MKEDYLESQLHAFRILKLKWGEFRQFSFTQEYNDSMAQWFQEVIIEEVYDIRIHFKPADKYALSKIYTVCTWFIVDYNSLLSGDRISRNGLSTTLYDNPIKTHLEQFEAIVELCQLIAMRVNVSNLLYILNFVRFSEILVSQTWYDTYITNAHIHTITHMQTHTNKA